jgi:hypothetical protein
MVTASKPVYPRHGIDATLSPKVVGFLSPGQGNHKWKTGSAGYGQAVPKIQNRGWFDILLIPMFLVNGHFLQSLRSSLKCKLPMAKVCTSVPQLDPGGTARN